MDLGLKVFWIGFAIVLIEAGNLLEERVLSVTGVAILAVMAWTGN